MQPDMADEALLSCRLVAALFHFRLTFDTQTLVYSMYTNMWDCTAWNCTVWDCTVCAMTVSERLLKHAMSSCTQQTPLATQATVPAGNAQLIVRWS